MLHPYVATKHPKVDVVIVRENEEDLYAGIEHRQTNEVYQCLKIISRPGCERIVRYAFEYARANNRKRVTCVVKDNIMKLTDGLFAQVFESIGAQEYPDIKRDRMIVDICAAMLADHPERFDVMVMPNLYGDILSDIAAQVTGSVGLGGSSNIGEEGRGAGWGAGGQQACGRRHAGMLGRKYGRKRGCKHGRKHGRYAQARTLWPHDRSRPPTPPTPHPPLRRARGHV